MNCSSCGYKNEKNSTNCIICGNRLNINSKKNKNKKNVVSYIILIICILLSINVCLSKDEIIKNINIKNVDYVDCTMLDDVEYCKPTYDVKIYKFSQKIISGSKVNKDEIKDISSNDIKKYIDDNNILVPIAIGVFIISYLVLSIIYGIMYPIIKIIIAIANTIQKSTKVDI